MITTKKPGIESFGYTNAQLKAIVSAKTADSVQISGVTTSVNRANVKKLVGDLASGKKPLEDCGLED
jgi:hypothetical protein